MTARLRLTLLYAGMFLLLGTALIGLIYVLTSRGSVVHSSAAAALPVPSKVALSSVAVIPKQLDAQRSADLDKLLGVSWVVLALTALAAAALGWFASGRVLRPLRQMTETAQTISAGNLGQRLALAGPDDEFKRLGDTFDELLGRLQTSFEAQRRFVANASHELRTPLTLERTLLEVALANPNAGSASLRMTCEELLTVGREQERLLEALLTLASTERGLERREPLSLDELAGRALLTRRPEIERGALTLSSAIAPAPSSGEPALVERLIANLIDNAVRYNVAGGRVGISTGVSGDYALVSVTNTGPVVPPDELERLFEPFERFENGRTSEPDGHHGLGLSIVRAIAVAHDATVSAQPRAGGGLTVTVSFPAATR